MTATSASFYVLVVALDEGAICLADRAATIGPDQCVPAILQLDAVTDDANSNTGIGCQIERQALPDEFRASWWTNRAALVLEVDPASGSVYDGTILFDGIVDAEPSETNGILTIHFIPSRQRVVNIPAMGVISTATYPQADPSAVGQQMPMIIGTVDNCPLLPVKTVPTTTLGAAALPGDTGVQVADATDWPTSGAVLIDGEPIAYSSKSDNELLGCVVRQAHAAGSVVAAVGEVWYLAAGHDCASIGTVKGDGFILPGGTTASSRVVYPGLPVVDGTTTRDNVLLQFDQVSGGAFVGSYPLTYPVVETLQDQDNNTVRILGDLDVLILPPATLASGSYTFTFTVQAAPDQTVTNASQVYSASIGGHSFSVPKAGGTVTVTFSLASVAPLRLFHDITGGLSAPDQATLLAALAVDQSAYDLQYAVYSGIEDAVPQITKCSVTWSQASAVNPALNPTNAIRALTATVAQNAAGWDSAIAATGTGNIIFARPNSDRIIKGAYQVAYTVAINGFAGRAALTIGSQTVWVADGGAPIYHWSPATITQDDDTDALPVKLDGGAGQVVVTITAANRTVGTGNIDGGKYATLRWSSNNKLFRAVQTDDNPDRGRIARVQLAIEWFSNGTPPANTVAVRWGGRLLGYLAASILAGSTVSNTVSVDVTGQGNASLTNSNISTSVSGGTSSLSNLTSTDQFALPLAYAYRKEPTSGIERYRCQCTFKAPPNLVAGNYNFEIQSVTGGQNNFSASLAGNSFSLVSNGSAHTTVYVSANQSITFAHEIVSGLYSNFLDEIKAVSILATWNVSPVSLSSTAATGSTTVPNGNLPVSGVSVRTNNGAISVTIPDSPRTVITEFFLPEVADWPDMTGKAVDVELLSSCPDIYLVQVQLVVDYDEVTSAAPKAVSATVTGYSGNPADVLAQLAAATREAIDLVSFARLRAWATANNYLLAQRIDQATDALTLMANAAEQTNALLVYRYGLLSVVRWYDLASPITMINETDLLTPAQITWDTTIYNNIALQYRQDYVGNAGFTGCLTATASNNASCRASLAAIQETRSVTYQASWLRDDATAALFLADYTRRYARPRRLVQLNLPFIYTIQPGDLIEFRESVWRVTTVTNDQGWPTITAEEITD